MDKSNIDFILNIFKSLSGEIPETVLYREYGDSFELETLDAIGNYTPADVQSDGWSMIGCPAA